MFLLIWIIAFILHSGTQSKLTFTNAMESYKDRWTAAALGREKNINLSVRMCTF